MIAIRTAELLDLLHILDHASSAMKADMEGFKADQNRLMETFDRSMSPLTITVDDVPVLCFGGDPDNDHPHRWYTWMFYTDTFYKHHAEINRLINEALDTAPVALGCKLMTLYSILFLPKAEEWYNGFKFYRVGQVGTTLISGNTVPVIEFERRY